MQNSFFIAGDWGNSNLRLYLCEMTDTRRATLHDSRSGPGIREIEDDFESVFFSLCGDWIEQHGNVPVILSGAVGSNIGWRSSPYLSCPVDAATITAGCVQFISRGISFSLLSGVKAHNPLGVSDVMRGEELQLLGWLQNNSPDDRRHSLLTLPGTHNKWLSVSGGQLTTFLTAYSGELFELLRQRSILVSEGGGSEIDETAFLTGVKTIETSGSAQLVHTLFSTRSKQVLEEMPTDEAASYLSGLIIGADVSGALNIFSGQHDVLPQVVIIAEETLAKLYSITLNHFNIEANRCDSEEIAICGYTAIYNSLVISKQLNQNH